MVFQRLDAQCAGTYTLAVLLHDITHCLDPFSRVATSLPLRSFELAKYDRCLSGIIATTAVYASLQSIW